MIEYMETVSGSMTDQRRALLTERERELLLGEADVTDNYRYSVESRIRSRIRDRLGRDVDVIRTHYPEMFDELVYPIVCQPEPTTSTTAAEHTASEPLDSVDDDPSGDHGETATSPPAAQGAAAADKLRDRARAALDALEVKGRGDEVVATRREAVLYAWDLVRSRGETTSSELTDDVWEEFADRRTGYSASSSATRADGYNMWDNCVRDLLKELPGIEAPPERGNEWRWVGVDDA